MTVAQLEEKESPSRRSQRELAAAERQEKVGCAAHYKDRLRVMETVNASTAIAEQSNTAIN